MKSIINITHIFDEKDLESSGQYLVKTNKLNIKDTGYLSTIMYKIGYLNNPRSYMLVSMSDGWGFNGWYDNLEPVKEKQFTLFENRIDLINFLNNNPHNESYRFATKKEILRVIKYQSPRWLLKLI